MYLSINTHYIKQFKTISYLNAPFHDNKSLVLIATYILYIIVNKFNYALRYILNDYCNFANHIKYMTNKCLPWLNWAGIYLFVHDKSIYRLSCVFAGSHCKNNCCCTCNSIAAGINLFSCCFK